MLNLLDKNGNIDSSRLEKELYDALAEDIKYRQVDNMKKRAVNTSVNYDEFKSKVLSASMKPLDRKEIESLKDVKKGWIHKNKSNTSDIHIDYNKDTIACDIPSSIPIEEMPTIFSHAAVKGKSLLEKHESDKLLKTSISTSLSSSSSSTRIPKNVSEMERDMRRCPTMDTKLRYLESIGLKRFVTLMNANQSVDLYEEVLTLLVDTSTITTQSVSTSSVNAIQLESEITKLVLTDDTLATNQPSTANSTTLTPKSNELTLTLLSERIKWIKSMADLKDFSMLLCFMSSSLKERLTTFLHAAKTNYDNNGVLNDDVTRIIDSYKLN